MSETSRETHEHLPAGAVPFIPSNGTEGECFHEEWCYRCALYGDPGGPIEPCQIQGNALAGIQPPQWLEDDRGPRCTAFRTEPPAETLDPAAVIRPLI